LGLSLAKPMIKYAYGVNFMSAIASGSVLTVGTDRFIATIPAIIVRVTDE